MHRAILRLHRRVRQVRHIVHSVDLLRGLRQAGNNVALFARDAARFLYAIHKHLADTGARDIRAGAFVPSNGQLLAALHRRPRAVGNHRHAARRRDDVLYSGHGLGFRAVEACDLAAEYGAAFHHGVDHSIGTGVQAEDGLPVHLRARIQALHRLADDFEIFRVLQLDGHRYGDFRGVVGQRTVAQLCADRSICVGRRIDDESVFGAALRRRDIPALRRGLRQHFASLRASGAQRHPRGADRLAADGGLMSEGGRIDGRHLDAHFGPIAFQFFGQHLRTRRGGPLPHFALRNPERDAVVGGDVDIRHRLARGRRSKQIGRRNADLLGLSFIRQNESEQ